MGFSAVESGYPITTIDLVAPLCYRELKMKETIKWLMPKGYWKRGDQVKCRK